ncbi:bis(5'-nucleosyl)-tetraphosphatase (symmetrical) YqeK [Anaerotruncus sp. DFI.9.16]|uniref:bis(5'-nucleosyl)-tetraphosphatase (symmetrical) YqeK n=1 Tax=Anaerotruncus sp. DFI.9.16 TaxID=2965275 RepID=UPI00210B277F|nr:bis(5'-nucleosyl)-tetraphosphatase (symmetrical) YqeK [Anaerotruncus sp. DFI.9.16]MCQ4894445.1 bis(5'-nucleosyl)-tetraphosphatase (symmetrical) YqeK [Anaerotruncus sp. DFI.9.16]
MEYDLKKLDKLAKKTLSAKRYYHTQCVVQQAQKLARLYGCDEQKAMVAGWMHDICKEIPREEQLQWLTKCGIILDSVQESQPKTWHGMAACGFISEKLGITDPEILHAIRFHTTACGHMTELDEVVYLADLTSVDRVYPDILPMRKLAETALKPAMKEAMRYAVNDLVERSLGISFDTFQAYNVYMAY